MASSVTNLRVLRTERLTPHMIRVVAGGSGLASFADNGFTDRYVKVLFPQSGVTYPEPFDMDLIRREFPREQWPVTRTYTVRALDAGEMAIDFVYHGDEGLAGPWAAAAKPGDRLLLLGPGGAYAPEPAADWHLLVGDEAALPAIALALERMPADATVRAVIEVGDAAERQHLATPAGARVTWLHRDSADGTADQPALLRAVRDLDFPAGRVHAFVHGEAGAVKLLRRHLLDERGVSRDSLSVSGYWRRGKTEDGFRVEKAEEASRERAAATA